MINYFKRGTKLGLGLSLKKPTLLQGFSNALSLNFDGTNDYLNVANSSALDVGTGDFSISCWAKTNGSVSSSQMLVDRNHVTGYSIYVVSGGALKIAIHGSYLNISGNDIDDSRWHHVVASYDRSGNLNAYLDGALVGTKDISGDTENLNNSSALGIGRSTSSGLYFDGNIDEVALWHTALDANAVAAIYNSGTPTDLNSDLGDYDNSSHLKGYWRMGDGTLDEYPLIADQINPTLGSELNDNNWTLNNGGVGNWSQDGTSLISDDSAVSRGYNGGTVTVGSMFKISYDITAYTSGDVRVDAGHTNGTVRSGVGSYSEYLLATSNTNLYINQSSRAFVGTVDNISVKVVNGNPGNMTNMVSGDIEEDTP